MADSPDMMHQATIGSAVMASRPMSYRCDPNALLERYGMWVHRCVTLNASAAACIPFKLYTVDTSGDMRRFGRAKSIGAESKAYIRGQQAVQPSPSVKATIRGYEDSLAEVTDHPALSLLDNVNRWTEGYGYRESLYADLQIFGRAYTLIVGNGEPEELWRMPPQKMQIIRDPADFVASFLFGDSTNKVEYAPEEVLWFRLFDPVNPWEGFGPLEAWLKTIDSMHHVASFQDELFRRGGAPDYIVTSKRDLGQEQKRSFRREWRRMFSRLFKREETIGFLGGEDVDLKKLTESPRELEFTASQDQLRDTIGQAFGVPKALLTADDVNRTNAMEASNSHIRLTIWPMVQRVEDVLNEQLIRRWGDGLFIMHENPIREDATIRVADRASKLASGWTINEVRADEGAEALDDEYGDVPMVAAGLTTLERAVDGSPMPDMPGPFMDDTEDDEDDTEEMDDEEADTRSYRLVRSPTPCGCGDTRSQRDMWAKARASGKPDEIDEPASELAKALANFFLVRILDVADEVEGSTAVPGLDVLLPDSTRAEDEAAAAAISRPHVEDAVQASASKAIAEVGQSITFDMDNQRVQAFLADQSRIIGRAATDSWRAEIRDILIDATTTSRTVPEIAASIRATTDRAGWKAERIATTEIGLSNTAARDQAFAQSDVVIGKEWRLSDNACPLCEAMASEFNAAQMKPGEAFLKAEPGKEYSYLDNGKERRVKIDYRDIIGGDAHPYCRCTIGPVLAEQ